MLLGTRLAAAHQRFESAGLVDIAYIDYTKVSMLRLTDEVSAIVSFSCAGLVGMGVAVNAAKTVASLTPGHVHGRRWRRHRASRGLPS